MFTQNVHSIAKCTDEKCDVEEFLKVLMENIFNEELPYDERRKCFVEYCLSHIKVFNAMFLLHSKGKENIEKIEHLISGSNELLAKHKKDCAELRRLTAKKYLIQRKIDDLISKIYS